MNPNTMRKLLQDYNKNPDRYNNKEAEAIALMARGLGQNFRRESKPIRKALYQAGEMASFGLLPDSWEPHSRGESVYGQTAIDKMASGLGMAGGLAGGLIGGAKLVSGASGMLKGGGKDAIRKIRQRMSQAGVNIKGKVGDVAGAVGSSAVGRIGSNLGRAGKAFGQAGVNTARLQGMRAADALSRRLGVPYETAVKILQYGGGGAVGLGALSTMGSEINDWNKSDGYDYGGDWEVRNYGFRPPLRDKKIPGAMY